MSFNVAASMPSGAATVTLNCILFWGLPSTRHCRHNTTAGRHIAWDGVGQPGKENARVHCSYAVYGMLHSHPMRQLTCTSSACSAPGGPHMK